MKTVKFFKSGNTVRVFDYDDEQVIDKLKPAIYTICQDMSGYYLSFVNDKFDVPDKIYGSTNDRADKILKTYDDRRRSTGVLMSGDKGSGKTMLSSLLCNKMVDRGLPVILIEKPYSGSDFIDLLNNIGECAILFDEFGKVFATITEDGEEDTSNRNQNSLLSVFDGAHTIKRLILLTENETYRINEYMLNRPGRIYYHFKYTKLEEDLVREYCSSKKVPKDVIDSILLKIDASSEFSFDALQAVVEEYNRFKDNIEDIFSRLNIENKDHKEKKARIVKIIDYNTGEEFEPVEELIKKPSSSGSTTVHYLSNEELDVQPDVIQRLFSDGATKEKDGKARPIKRAILYSKCLVERTSNRQVYHCKDHGDVVVILENYEEETFPKYGTYLDV